MHWGHEVVHGESTEPDWGRVDCMRANVRGIDGHALGHEEVHGESTGFSYLFFRIPGKGTS